MRRGCGNCRRATSSIRIVGWARGPGASPLPPTKGHGPAPILKSRVQTVGGLNGCNGVLPEGCVLGAAKASAGPSGVTAAGVHANRNSQFPCASHVGCHACAQLGRTWQRRAKALRERSWMGRHNFKQARCENTRRAHPRHRGP